MNERAVALEREHHEHNPSTGFYLLMEQIKEE